MPSLCLYFSSPVESNVCSPSSPWFHSICLCVDRCGCFEIVSAKQCNASGSVVLAASSFSRIHVTFYSLIRQTTSFHQKWASIWCVTAEVQYWCHITLRCCHLPGFGMQVQTQPKTGTDRFLAWALHFKPYTAQAECRSGMILMHGQSSAHGCQTYVW